MIIFPCNVCNTPMQVPDDLGGKVVRCPTCLATQSAPAKAAVQEDIPLARANELSPEPAIERPPVIRAMPRRGTGKRYGFNCPHCSSRLEATDAMGGDDGQCPTCGMNITIPILDRYGRLIDPKTQQIIKQDPHPVHAYAAAGERAPQIQRLHDGAQVIQCPRCRTTSPVTANNCRSCGMPFTMEGTTIEAAGASNGFCVASLVLGIIGIPTGCLLIPPILAVVFGIVGLTQTNRAGGQGGRGMGIAGLILGAIGSFMGLMTAKRWW